MPQSATFHQSFAFVGPTTLVAAFDAGRATSDGGLPWLAEADRQLGVCAALAACVPEWRGPRVRHSREDLVRQRVLQIACGYADQDDADTLRRVKFTSLYASLDFLIVPAKSSLMPQARNVKLRVGSHPGMVLEKASLRAVADALRS